MKTQFIIKKLRFLINITVILFTLFFTTYCGKKSNSSSSRAGTAGRGDLNSPIGNANTLGVNKCTNGAYTRGRIVADSSQFGTDFRQSFADYLSAVISPDNLGNLDGSPNSVNTGVDIDLKIKVVNNQINLDQTSILIEITDSFVGQPGTDGNRIDTIKIPYSRAANGQITNFNGNAGHFQLLFRDDYGVVSVEGDFNGNTTTGRVSFENKVSYVDPNTANQQFSSATGAVKSGILGVFTLNTCGVIF